MTNDAKLGLLAGVFGVVAAAVLTGQNPAPEPVAAARVSAVQAADKAAGAVAPAVLPAELASTPVARTNREPDGTPASRGRMDDVEP